jgi:arsenate reductase
MIKIYGIPNCDSCRKARSWLDRSNRDFGWQDLRADPPDENRLRRWIAAVGLERLVNRRSTTWRHLDEDERALAMDADSAPTLLERHPTLIKRPVIEHQGDVMVGFDESVKQAL